jgi:hypothetical protein
VTIHDIRPVKVDAGEAVVLEWPPGEASPEWAETEFRGTWETVEPSRKFFIAYDPTA